MSHAASTWAWEQDIPTGPKFVLIDLADRHNGQSGKCVARVATIAARTGQSARSVQRHLGDLVQAGLIALQSRHKRAHRFILRLPEAARPVPAPQAGAAPIRDTVSPITPEIATQCHPEPEGRDSTGRKEEREAPASPPPPAPVSLSSADLVVEGEGKQASRIEAEPVEAPEPPANG